MKTRHLIIISCIMIAFLAINTIVQVQLNKKQVGTIQSVVHDYLVQNPQILVQMSQELQQQQLKQMQEDAVAAIKQNKDQVFNDKGKPVAGNIEGNIVMVEMFDYQCPHCKVVASYIEQLTKNNPQLKVIFAELPIFGAGSKYATQAAIASMKQGKYLELHNALLARKDQEGALNQAKVLATAKAAGLNVAKLKKDIQTEKQQIEDQIKDNMDIARTVKLQGTPTFIVGNLKTDKFAFIPGQVSQDDLQKAIDSVK